MRIPSFPCCPAFTLLCDDQNLKIVELGTNILKQALHTEVRLTVIWWDLLSGIQVRYQDSEDKQQVASLNVLLL